ncbi:MAG TPA: galactose mutarotase [Polyangiaceae bacterium]|jgi:galactose mutarotase-like enzyme
MITLSDGRSRAEISAERGGMVTRFSVAGREVLYLDEETLADPTKNVRGGVPVLFPSPGPLAGGRFAMKQHGFARNLPWRVVASDSKSVALALSDDEVTRAQYPWRFALEYRYSVAEGTLRIDQTIENRDDSPMPYAAGFHPYFFVREADKSRACIPTGATRAWDNVAKREIALDGIDLTLPEVDLHLIDHGKSEATLELGDARVVVRGSDAYRRWVVWTLRGKDFVCLEPWTAPANALNTGEGLRVVAPGARDELFVEITIRGT